ncbi:hypothetical protein B7P43_G08357 [Cryptotermes secundus]|uniref:Uncharacterized protein n=1 Tax=Cryptotermes secundus TaxID=105785 RepID=A0A2J7PEJ5_9NEOP|nr:hypothetical protein B7P43_G08357 [Cryptotermes secundus]
MFENRVLRRIFVPKRYEVTGGWREGRSGQHIGYCWESREEGDHWGNIKMDFREIVWDGTDWIDLFQDRDQWRALVNKVMSFRVP